MLWKNWLNICLHVSISVTLLCLPQFMVASETLFVFFLKKKLCPAESTWNLLILCKDDTPACLCDMLHNPHHCSRSLQWGGTSGDGWGWTGEEVKPQVSVSRACSPLSALPHPFTNSPPKKCQPGRCSVHKGAQHHCHWQERLNDRVKTCQPRSLPVRAVLTYSSAVHHYQPPAGKDNCNNILTPSPDQPTTSYVWPRVVCNTHLWFRIDMEPCNDEPSQAHRNAPNSLWFVILQAPWEYHGY